MHDHAHDQENEGGEGLGMAIGFRIFEDAGELYMAEAEISPYVDEPASLGATLVFHPLADLDPTTDDEDAEWATWATDVDDELTRDETGTMQEQFQGILRQLSKLSEDQLREYLQRAREESGTEDAE